MHFHTDEAVDPLSQALEDAICSMKLEEECDITLTMDTTLATSPMLREAPHNCVLSYTIHLVSFVRAPEVWSLSAQNRQTLASQHKAIGTEQFKINNVYGASLHYSKALKYVISIDSHTTESDALKKTLYLNLAACQLKLKQYSNVIKNCNCVLESGVDDVKALYRRGQALAAMNDFDGAKQDYLKVFELEPNNTAIVKLLRQLEDKARAHNSKFRDALKEMFS